MKLRYLDDITVIKAIIHVLDKGSDKAILNNELLELDDAFLNEYIVKHVIKTLRDDTAQKIEFEGKESIIQNMENLNNKKNFVEYSKTIANRMFELIKGSDLIPSSDLLVCEVMSNSKTFYGIMKLDYQSSYTHEIDFENDKLKVSLAPYTIGLPDSNQKLKKAVFINCKEGDYSGLIINTNKKSDDEHKKEYFIKQFVKGKNQIDDTQKTKIVKTEVENWARKNLKTDIDKASMLREKLNESLVEKDEVSIKEVVEDVLTFEQKENFIKHIEDKGIKYEEPIIVDRNWVDKKTKSKSIKTDTGITIRGNFDVFKDKMVFEMKRNGDGTVDYIIKNVRNISER